MGCRETLPLLKESRASVVNVASIMAHRNLVDFSSYSASKGGIVSMSRRLAGDLARYGIRVNTVSPGAVHTGITKNSCHLENQPGNPNESMPSVAADELLGALQPNDVAETVVSLLHLRGVTGQDIIV